MSNTDCISAHAGAHCAKEASAAREHAGPDDDAAAAEPARTLNAILAEQKKQTQLLDKQTQLLEMQTQLLEMQTRVLTKHTMHASETWDWPMERCSWQL